MEVVMEESSSTQNEFNGQSREATATNDNASTSMPSTDPNIFYRLIPIVSVNMFNQPQKVIVDVEELSKAINIHQNLLSNAFTQNTISLLPKESIKNLQNYEKIYTFLSTASDSLAPTTSMPLQSTASTQLQDGISTSTPSNMPSSSITSTHPSTLPPTPPSTTDNAYFKKLENLLSQIAILSNFPPLSSTTPLSSSSPPSTHPSSLPSTLPLTTPFEPSLEPGPSGKMKNLFLCDKCGKGFHARRNLYFHERQVHDLQETICPDCGRPLRNHAALLRHRRTHLGPHEMIHVCLKCGKRCKERRHLIIHCSNLGHPVPPPPIPDQNPFGASTSTGNNMNQYLENDNYDVDGMDEEELIDGYDDDIDGGSIQ